MPIEIRVPSMGESVTVATVARWLKQPGDVVAADEAVVELGALLGTIEAGGVAATPAKPAATPKAAPVAAPVADAPPAASALEVAGEFDVIVIGSGPGGYVFAIRAAQLGLKTACVEKRATLGGTCLNIGCIPSKALLQSSENFYAAQGPFKDHGILIDSVKLDLARMQARKAEVVTANVKGVEFLFKKNKITWLKGTGRIAAPGQVSVDGKIYNTRHIVIATGSESIPLPGVTVDEKRIVTSTGALELDAVPKRLVVIGGGYIGLELGSVWQRLGAQVTVVEFLDHLVTTMDREVGKAFERVLAKQGLKFRLSTKVTAATVTDAGVTLTVEKAAGKTALPVAANGSPQGSLAAMIFASIATSVPFALMHAEQTAWSLGPFLLLVCVSLVLCWARLATRSLAASVLVHATYNLLLFSLMLWGTSGFKHLDNM